MTKLSKLTLLLASAALKASAQAPAKCYTLAFSSGQESAAYQAGVMKSLAQTLGAEAAYHAVSGISGGAVNAAVLGAFPKGQEAAAAAKMEQFWTAAGSTKLYQDWWGGVVAGLFDAGGIYDDSPLLSFLTQQFSDLPQVQREVTVGLTDVLSGEFKEFQEDVLSNNGDMLNVLYASFAFPGFFPPVEAFGTKWFDGSAVYDVDIFSSVNKCLDAGFKEEDVVVDVVFTSAANLNQVDAEQLKAVGMFFRYLEISSFYQTMDGLLRAKFSFPKANFRYAIAPSKPLPSSIYPLVKSF